MPSPFVPRSKDQRAKLRDDRPRGDQLGNPVVLTCGCQLMRLPEITSPERRWFCCGAYQTVKR